MSKEIFNLNKIEYLYTSQLEVFPEIKYHISINSSFKSSKKVTLNEALGVLEDIIISYTQDSGKIAHKKQNGPVLELDKTFSKINNENKSRSQKDLKSSNLDSHLENKQILLESKLISHDPYSSTFIISEMFASKNNAREFYNLIINSKDMFYPIFVTEIEKIFYGKERFSYRFLKLVKIY